MANGTDSSDSAGFLKGYVASTPESANSPNRPSDQQYFAPGEAATAMKAAWKGKPTLLPNGEGDDATF